MIAIPVGILECMIFAPSLLEKEEDDVRALLAILGAVTMLMGLATQPAGAGPATAYEKFKKQIEKHARRGMESAFDPKPKGLCVCQDGSANNEIAGVLIFEEQNDTYLQVACFVRTFNPDGSDSMASRCNTFEILSK